MKSVKTISILLFFLHAFQTKAICADTLVVILDKQNFVKGDGIAMEVYTEPYRQNRPAQSLHVWIEHVKTGQRWKYRYPFINGRATCTLKISERIPDGVYAFNFLLQQDFLSVKGKLLNQGMHVQTINFLANARNMAPIIDEVSVDATGNFIINNLVFTDSVYFGFSPINKSKTNPLKIALETTLDSVFIPVSITTELISIGTATKKQQDLPVKLAESYFFTIEDKQDKELLQEIILKTKAKNKRELFEQENVSGLFSSGNAKTFAFYENDELKNYPDVFTYLTANVAGLTIYSDEVSGQTNLYWRKEKVNVYVDEVLNTDFSPLSLSVQEIEMIKIFSPGSRLGLDGFGGSVAIYTRKMKSNSSNKFSNYNFYIKGYTQKYAVWQ